MHFPLCIRYNWLPLIHCMEKTKRARDYVLNLIFMADGENDYSRQPKHQKMQEAYSRSVGLLRKKCRSYRGPHCSFLHKGGKLSHQFHSSSSEVFSLKPLKKFAPSCGRRTQFRITVQWTSSPSLSLQVFPFPHSSSTFPCTLKHFSLLHPSASTSSPAANSMLYLPAIV